MAQPVFNLSSDTYSSELEITSISGTESISKLFEIKVDFKVAISIANSLDHVSLTQDDIVIAIDGITGRDEYSIKGVFSQVEEVFEKSNTHKYYSATMVPSLWRQRNNQSYDVFTDKTTSDILSDELSNDLMLDHHLSLTQTYPVKDFICQYSESNFNFVCRMAEHWGIYYYFDHDQGGKLILADDTNYEPLPIGAIKLDQSNNPSNSYNSIRTLKRQFNAVPDSVIITETNPEQALELFQGIAGDITDGKTSVNMADEGADNKDEAELLAKIRLEELQTNATVFSGTTGLACINPGFVLTVETPNGAEFEILIVSVSHNGNNLDNSARAQNSGSQPFYECSFTGIPRETQYRPKRDIQTPSVISTTARVYSAADDQTLAQRNETGRYQVTFDFMNGEEGKISSWIRHASHTARSNHFDMPLTPGTEVQIGFVGGNPNRPYILNALENSQSVIHPVTNENPHHAAMITDGMLYTGALKSRQSLHMSADLDPTEVKEHINNNALQHLSKMGLDSGNPVDVIKGEVHINRTYGERYQWREGVDFNYGLNATYNFGQQYIENHSDEKTADAEIFDIPGLDSTESTVAGNTDDVLQAGLADERKSGLVTKNFGNQYQYDEGITRTWAKGPDASGQHSTLNFGGRYIENQLKSDSGDPDTSGLNGTVSDKTLAIKTVGDEARYNEGNIDVHHKGNLKRVQSDGSVSSELTGDKETKIISGTATVEESISGGAVSKTIMGASEDKLEKTITGDITETITSAGKVALTVTAGMEYTRTVNAPSTKETISGNTDLFKLAMKTETIIGLVNDNFIGGKVETFTGMKVTNTTAGEITIGKAADLRKHSSKLDQASTAIEKHQSKIVDGAIAMFKSKLNMIG